MAYKISQINLDRFRTAAQLAENISNLDNRLGIEGIIYNPTFRLNVSAYWDGQSASLAQIAPTVVCQSYRAVSERHTPTTDEQVQNGLEQIIDDPDFKDTCTQRWAQLDSEPPSDPNAFAGA